MMGVVAKLTMGQRNIVAQLARGVVPAGWSCHDTRRLSALYLMRDRLSTSLLMLQLSDNVSVKTIGAVPECPDINDGFATRAANAAFDCAAVVWFCTALDKSGSGLKKDIYQQWKSDLDATDKERLFRIEEVRGDEQAHAREVAELDIQMMDLWEAVEIHRSQPQPINRTITTLLGRQNESLREDLEALHSNAASWLDDEKRAEEHKVWTTVQAEVQRQGKHLEALRVYRRH